MKNKLISLTVLLLFTAFLGITTGPVKIPIRDLLLAQNNPILVMRILRVLTAAVAGAGLAVAGITLQAILRNPLAEPYLLGTSSGAGLGAVIAVMLGVSGLYMPLAAFIGAILSIVLVYNLASQNNRIPEQSLILSGVIVSVALSAIIVFLISISANEALHGMTWWLWGNIQVFDPKLIFLVSVLVAGGSILIYIFSQDLNAISIGEEEAIHLGIKVETVKKYLVIIASVITSAIVCICGIIGFVGLIVPHMMRLVVGPNHKKLIPATCISAAIFMILCDIIARTACPPLEIPIGVITAVLGAPVFIILLKRRQKIK